MIVCPECKKEMKLLPEREGTPSTIPGEVSLTLSTTTFTGQSYTPTSTTFKCSNPECWVTKLNLSWS